jgi:hypothetical protein
MLMNVRRNAASLLALVPLGLAAGCDGASVGSRPEPTATRTGASTAHGWRSVRLGTFALEVPAAWPESSLQGPCLQNDPCSSDDARLSAHVFVLKPLPGQRGGTGMSMPPRKSNDGWRGVAALPGADVYVFGDTKAEVSRVLASAKRLTS